MTQNIVSVNEWRKPSRSIILTILVLVIFFILSQYNFLIFHSLAEMVSIVIAWGVFMLVWNSRRIINNDNLVSLGIALLFVGLIDGLHTLAYKGMGIFDTELSTNYATQLWIAARVLQSLSLLLFTSFLRSMIKPSYMFIGYLAITVGLLLSIFLWNLFPVCYVEGSGLTYFKVIAEYFIVLVIICALILIRHNRHKFDKRVYQMMVAAMITTIATELTFTLYVDVYGVLNILGHVLKILSFIFIYNALVRSSLIRPYETMFRQLEQEKRSVENSEKQLNNTNAKQEALIKNISDVIGIVDQKGINRYKSSNVEKWFGWKPQELIGKDTWANVHADDLEQVQAAFGTILQNDLAVVTAEYRYLCKNGDYKWIEATATNLISDKNINGILLNYHDITERKQAEEELVGTKFVLDTTTDAVYWMQQDGQFVDVNDAACKKLGYTRDELLAMHVNDMNPDYPADRWPATWELIKQEKSVNIEAHHKTKDGLVFPVEIQANYVQFGDKERICSYVSDITERKQAEEALLESISLRELLLDIITHDLKNPAGVINALSETGRKYLPENRIMETIFSTSERLIEVINQTTILSQATFGETIPKEPLSLNKLLQETVDEFASTLSAAEMDLVVTMSPDLVIEANPLIREVFKNYISNAIKYARDGKRIVIETVIEDQTVMVCVKDFGKTITEADRTAVFKRQVQLEDGEKRGRGLGLAIVKRIAEAHGGEVWVEPNTPTGNSFCLRILR